MSDKNLLLNDPLSLDFICISSMIIYCIQLLLQTQLTFWSGAPFTMVTVTFSENRTRFGLLFSLAFLAAVSNEDFFVDCKKEAAISIRANSRSFNRFRILFSISLLQKPSQEMKAFSANRKIAFKTEYLN